MGPPVLYRGRQGVRDRDKYLEGHRDRGSGTDKQWFTQRYSIHEAKPSLSHRWVHQSYTGAGRGSGTGTSSGPHTGAGMGS